nr:heavy metal translocating P-type ATPase [uncultured Flavobacterium sp.]
MKHQHIFNESGICTICGQTEKIYNAANKLGNKTKHERAASADGHSHSHSHNHDHSELSGNIIKLFYPVITSLVLLLLALYFDHYLKPSWFTSYFRFGWYLLAYLPVAVPVIKDAYFGILKKDIFSEFFLMCIATFGAFILGEYPEGVAVMLFYAVGENFQTIAVSRAQANIKALLDQRPDEVTILENNQPKTIKAKEAKINDIIQLKPGEKLGLDGILISESASFNTAALTGESKPDTKRINDEVLAGMINLNTLSLVKVTTKYSDSKLSKILELVKNAASKKAPTELFISKFARIYTPIVCLLAVLITFVPYFFVENYMISEWGYRALIFLVISCPCALVISIPLGYFGGIGAASRNGILVKGSNYLDVLASVEHVVMDKTGTLTEGIFKVQEVVIEASFDKDQILKVVNVIESKSSHPVATAIHEFVGELDSSVQITTSEEISGRGLKAVINDDVYLVGNLKLLQLFDVAYPNEINNIVYTIITIAKNNTYVGYITIADAIKTDAAKTISELSHLGIETTMLSGDKSSVVDFVAKELKLKNAFGDLLPADKVKKVEDIKNNTQQVVAFVGDGINDAPVIALSDVGIAMGGLGSDAAIETADVVIQNDEPYKITTAIKIGKKTKQIVWQNISLAFVVKAIVLILGAGGLATMWEAVFADVGVSLLAILNAIRIQKSKY